MTDHSSTKFTPGALRAAYLIGAQTAGKPNHPSFWTTETYDSLAALIDHETAAAEMYAALEQIIRYADGNPHTDPAVIGVAMRALAKARGVQ